MLSFVLNSEVLQACLDSLLTFYVSTLSTIQASVKHFFYLRRVVHYSQQYNEINHLFFIENEIFHLFDFRISECKFVIVDLISYILGL
jgi:hypothetical protein